jgi:hypothetical protein
MKMAAAIDPGNDFDPSGDTLLIVKNPRVKWLAADAFTMWPDHLPQHQSNEAKLEELMIPYALGGLAQNDQDKIRTQLHDALQRGEDGTAVRSEQRPGEPATDEATTKEAPTEDPPAPEVRMRLSSKHSILASKYFESALTQGFAESQPVSGYAHVVTADSMFVEALQLVFSIVHGQTHQVPRTISLDLLAKVAVVVDYYKFHKAVDFYFHVWIKEISQPRVWLYGPDFLLRLVVACIFQETDIFTQLTLTVLWQARGPIHELGVAPLSRIVGKHLPDGGVFMQMSNRGNGPSRRDQAETHCSADRTDEDSHAKLLYRAQELLVPVFHDPEPQAPFHGLGMAAVEAGIENIRAYRWYEVSRGNPIVSFGTNTPHGCRLSHYTRPVLDSLDESVLGLAWSSFFQPEVPR